MTNVIQLRPTKPKRTNYITYKSGSEGPRHDPYHFEEVTIHGRAGNVTAHIGLGVWLSVNGHRMEIPEVDLDISFQRLTGISIDVAFRLYRKLPYRRHSRTCSGRSMVSMPGYPGERLYICEKCREVIDSSFNLAAVE
jgi:hypothetical protein